jgi:uncharacterized protein (DUF2141 family)
VTCVKAFVPVSVLAALLAPAVARAADDARAVLTVKVDHIAPRGGNLRLAIYDEKSFADDNTVPVLDKVVTATPPVQTVTFEGVPPGTYAIKMFQDANRNEKFDMNWLGLPSERYGFSRNAKPDWMRLSGPRFAAAKIELKPGANWTEIWLH